MTGSVETCKLVGKGNTPETTTTTTLCEGHYTSCIPEHCKHPHTISHVVTSNEGVIVSYLASPMVFIVPHFQEALHQCQSPYIKGTVSHSFPCLCSLFVHQITLTGFSKRQVISHCHIKEAGVIYFHGPRISSTLRHFLSREKLLTINPKMNRMHFKVNTNKQRREGEDQIVKDDIRL